MLLDYSGNDYYRKAGVDGLGYAGLLSMGLLVDGAGDDRYHNNQSWTSNKPYSGVTMGVGETASLGVLADLGAGTDEFSCFIPVTYGCQGFATRGALGMLVDEAGASSFLLEGGIPGNPTVLPSGQGGAAAGAAGVLYQKGDGATTYNDAQRGQGMGLCAAIGILIDMGGSDSYTSSSGTSQGYGLSAPCILDDPEFPSDAREGLGILRDFAGSDSYSNPSPTSCFATTRQDNALWVAGAYGVGLDEDPNLGSYGPCIPV